MPTSTISPSLYHSKYRKNKKRLIDHIMVYESCKFKINNYPHRQSF